MTLVWIIKSVFYIPLRSKEKANRMTELVVSIWFFSLSLGETLFRWDTNTCTHSLIPNGKYICVMCVCWKTKSHWVRVLMCTRRKICLHAIVFIERESRERERERAQQQIHQRFIVAGVCLLQQITTRTRIISQWAQKLCIITTFFGFKCEHYFMYTYFL